MIAETVLVKTGLEKLAMDCSYRARLLVTYICTKTVLGTQ